MVAASAAVLNLPALMIGVLLLAATVSYLTRGWERVTPYVAAALAATLALWLWRVDLSAPVRELPALLARLAPDLRLDLAAPLARLGFTFRLEAATVTILAASLVLVALAFILAGAVSQGRSFVPFTFVLMIGYTGLAFLTTGPLAPVLLAPLLLAALSSVGVFILQAGRLERPVGPLRSLIPPLLAFPLFLIAAWYIEQIPLNPQETDAARTAGQLLALGMIFLLAPVPLHGAVPATAQSAPPVVTALLSLLYQLALLFLLFRLVTAFPFTLSDTPLGTWLTWAGIATAVWGGLAAVGTGHPGRLWGYAALHDWGLILIVLAVPGVRTWPLVLFLYSLRAVSMFTAAAGLSVLEKHAGGLEEARIQGAGVRLPWSAAAFLLGGLGLAGFPLSAGFTGHWAALQTVAETDWRAAAVVLLASGGAILGFIRMARLLFGPLENRFLPRERPLNMVIAVILLLLSVSLAIVPQLLDGPISRALPTFSG